jgi:hypothetical protein
MVDAFVEIFPGAPTRGLVEPHIGLSWGEAKGGEIRTATPEFDVAAIFAERVKLFTPDMGAEEGQLRALEATVRLYRNHTGLDLGTATQSVRAAIAKGKAS